MDWSALVGIPYEDGGRGLDACDCYGLVRNAFLAGKGVDLGLYGECGRARAADLIGAAKSCWTEIAGGAEQPFDIILMSIRGGQHLGLVVRKGEMLHMPRDSFSVIERYDVARFRTAIQGFYRHGQQ